jgi:hypothetical protein
MKMIKINRNSWHYHIANLGRRYRWALDAYKLVRENEKASNLLVSLATERWSAFETSRKILKGEE